MNVENKDVGIDGCPLSEDRFPVPWLNTNDETGLD